jgi:hypothetical protein
MNKVIKEKSSLLKRRDFRDSTYSKKFPTIIIKFHLMFPSSILNTFFVLSNFLYLNRLHLHPWQRYSHPLIKLVALFVDNLSIWHPLYLVPSEILRDKLNFRHLRRNDCWCENTMGTHTQTQHAPFIKSQYWRCMLVAVKKSMEFFRAHFVGAKLTPLKNQQKQNMYSLVSMLC